MLYRVYKGLYAKATVLPEKSNILIVCEQILLTLLLCCTLCFFASPSGRSKPIRVSFHTERDKTRPKSLVTSNFPIFPQISLLFLLYSKAVAL